MKRVCRETGCPTLVDPNAYRGLCDTHRKTRDRARGSRQDRGYGTAFDRERRQWAARINAGEPVNCWRCGNPIRPGEPFHLGHDDYDRSITHGPEHPACNLSAAGRSAHN